MVVLATVSTATLAIANSTSHRDERGDVEVTCPQTPCPPFEELSERDVDIVRATAGHNGPKGLTHTAIVAGTFRKDDLAGSNPRVNLFINTDSDRDPEYIAYTGSDGLGVYKYTKNGLRRTGGAEIKIDDERATYTFAARSIGGPESYGWAFSTSHFEFLLDLSGEFSGKDRIPSGKGYLKHGAG